MAGPWERYAQASETPAGPWAKYGNVSTAEEAPPATFFGRMFEGDANADKPLLERGTNAMVLDAGKSVARQVGLTARAGLRGLASIPAMVGDAAGMRSSAAVEGLSDLMHLPRPENATERVSQDVASGMAGGGGMIGLGRMMYNSASSVASRVGDLLKSQPLLQTISNITGPGAASVTREAGGGPGAELVAGVVGAVAPGAAGSGTPEVIRRLMRGGEEGRQVVEQNLKTFQSSGYGTPSVGQASEKRLPRAIESVTSKTPGGAGRMQDTAEKGAEGLGGRVEKLADELAQGATSAQAGRKISDSIEGFKDGFKKLQGELYGRLDQHLPKDTPIGVSKTQAALKELNADIPGAPNLSEWFKNAKIQGIDAALEKDLKVAGETGKLPYEAIKKLRTLVGGELADSSLLADVPKSKWKALYAALSDDLGEAARAQGKDATEAWEWANQFSRTQLARLEQIAPVVGKDAPEKIFQAAMSGTREGATNLKATLDAMPKEARKTVAATVIRRMGLATPGKQDDLGEAFSAETFLTNWNCLSGEAKTQLFDRLGGTYRESLDEVAKVSSNLREGSKVFANPSGTQQAVSGQVAGGGALVALLTGHPEVAAAIGGATVAANQTARLMTNKDFVQWLAKSTRAPTGALGAELNTLAEISGKWNAEDKAAAADYLSAARKLPQR